MESNFERRRRLAEAARRPNGRATSAELERIFRTARYDYDVHTRPYLEAFKAEDERLIAQLKAEGYEV